MFINPTVNVLPLTNHSCVHIESALDMVELCLTPYRRSYVRFVVGSRTTLWSGKRDLENQMLQ